MIYSGSSGGADPTFVGRRRRRVTRVVAGVESDVSGGRRPTGDSREIASEAMS